MSIKQNVLPILLVESNQRGEHKMYRRIRDLREDRDLYQKDLANYLRCSQVCYSHYEMGKRDIPSDVLMKLADFYHTSTDYILERTDERKPYPPKKQGRGAE